jgi:hypothetical protein
MTVRTEQRDKITERGQPGQDNRDRTTGTEQPGQDYQDRTERREL